MESAFEVADVGGLAGIENQVADGSDQLVDAEGDDVQEEISQRSGLPALRFEGGVVDDQATDPTQEEGKQETNEIVVVFHFQVLLF